MKEPVELIVCEYETQPYQLTEAVVRSLLDQVKDALAQVEVRTK